MVRHIVRDIAQTRWQWLASVAVLLLGVSTGSMAAQEAPLKIGILNLDLVALESPSGKTLQQATIAFQEEVTRELELRQDAAREIEFEVANAGDSLTVEAGRELERRLQDALTEIQRYQQDKQQEAAAIRAAGMNRIQQELAPIIETIQAEDGYDLVLNSQSALIVIFSERIDITQLVIDRLAAVGTGSP